MPAKKKKTARGFKRKLSPKGLLTKVSAFRDGKYNDVLHIYLLGGIVLFVALVLLGWYGIRYLTNKPVPEQDVFFRGEKEVEEEQDIECDYRVLLNGFCHDSEYDPEPIVAVMVDNHMNARPPAALSQATVVYEAPVEGNFSRFMALFPLSQDVSKIGPVRSARPYYLDWFSEYGDAMYVHVGGSPDALDTIRRLDLLNINEMGRGWYFWRSPNRYAPHNTYTSSELWMDAWNDYGKEESDETFEPWAFDVVEPCEEECVSEVTIRFSSHAFTARWEYSTSTDQFVRYQGGALHKDENGDVIMTDNIIVQRVTARVIDAVGRQELDTIGKGKALVFTGGKVVEGTWKKESRTGRTKWLDNDNNPIALQGGTTWVEVVSQSMDVEWE